MAFRILNQTCFRVRHHRISRKSFKLVKEIGEGGAGVLLQGDAEGKDQAVDYFRKRTIREGL